MSEENLKPLTNQKKFKTWPILRRLQRTYLKAYYRELGIAMLFMVIAAALTAGFAALIQPVMDDVLVAGNLDIVVGLSVLIMALFILRGAATYIHTILLDKIGLAVVADIQKELLSHFTALDLKFFYQNPSGQLISRVTSDTNLVRNAVTDVLTGMVKSLLTFVFLAGVMFYQDWLLATAAFTVFPPAVIFVAWIGRRLRKQSNKIQEGLADLSDKLSQTFLGIRLVKAYGMENHESERLGGIIDHVRKTMFKTVKIGNLSTPVNETLAGVVMCGILIYGGHQVNAGETTAGALMSFITAFIMSYEPLKKLAKMNNKLQLGLGGADRIFDMIDTVPAVQDHENAKHAKFKAPSIVFKDVEFQYLEDEKKALDGVNIYIPAGQVTALVGPSGGGKTTILNLIPRFFDVTQGGVFIDDEPVQDFSLSSLRSHIALVSQDITIFDDTARANIAYGRSDASFEEVVAAAKAAEAHDFIESLPDKYETRLGEEGLRLSGGQRQRIAIARAILRDAPILLLDEATSALDNESERAIQKTLSGLQKGRTTLVIAHRLSTVQNADQILVLDQGKVAEKGTHNSLMNEEGIYARMYNAGFQN